MVHSLWANENQSCEAALSGDVVELLMAEDFSTLTLGQVKNLQRAFAKMDKNQISDLISLLGEKDITLVIEKVRAGEIKDTGINELLQKFAGTESLLIDLLELGASIPGIYSSQQAASALPRILKFLTKNHDNMKEFDSVLGRSRVLASSIRYALIQTITNSIKNAVDDYGPQQKNGKGFQRFSQIVRRYFFPHHNRAVRSVQFGQSYLRQLDRGVSVDKVVVQGGIGLDGLKYTEEEEASLFSLVTNTKEHFQKLIGQLKHVYGDEFSPGKAVNIPSANIYNIVDKIKGVELEEVIEDFDNSNLAELFAFDKIVSDAMKREWGRSRNSSDYLDTEVQLLFGALFRRMIFLDANYYKTTNQDSNESYTIYNTEHSLETVGSGKNKRTVIKTKIVSKTVYPSFEDLLDNDLETGSSSTSSERNSIIRRTQQLRATENPIRNKADEIENYISNIENNFQHFSSDHGAKNMTVAQLQNYLLDIEKQLIFLKNYKDWSEEQVLDQYSRDSFKNFKSRNKKLYDRYRTLKKLIPVITEALKRDFPVLYLTFDSWDFSHWVSLLKPYRNKNYAWKIGKALTAGGFVAGYNLHPDFQYEVDSIVDHLSATLQELKLKFINTEK